jgi:hypothetical protein
MRFSTLVAMVTSVACRPSVRKRSPSPMIRFQRKTSASTRARQPRRNRLCHKPHGRAAAGPQASVGRGAARHPVPLPRDPMATVGIGFEGRGGVH